MLKSIISRHLLLNVLKVKQVKGLDKPVLKVFSRASIIKKVFVDLWVEVYNGKKFIRFLVVPEMVGFRFGDFAFTKKMGIGIHKDKSKKK